MAWFLKSYRHEECDIEWTDEWSCACNDRCPVCDAEIEPYDYIDLSVIVEVDETGKRWAVLVSGPDAEDSPNYVQTCFDQKQDADSFAAQKIERLDSV